jgi:hypothetical protein
MDVLEEINICPVSEHKLQWEERRSIVCALSSNSKFVAVMSFIYETSREVMFSLQSDGNVKVV